MFTTFTAQPGIRHHRVGWSRTMGHGPERSGDGMARSRHTTVDHGPGNARQGGGRKRSMDRNNGPSPSPSRLEQIPIGVVRKVTCLYSITTKALPIDYYARDTENVASWSDVCTVIRTSMNQPSIRWPNPWRLFMTKRCCSEGSVRASVPKGPEMARQFPHCRFGYAW